MPRLSEEQELFIQCAMNGENILVDACIGSGKTTTIQALCNICHNKNILYLTYNKLLKIDAKNKINTNCYGSKIMVTNYHGFAFSALCKANIQAGRQDMIQVYNNCNLPVDMYDLLIIDEYQDIEQELADLLNHIKDENCKKREKLNYGKTPDDANWIPDMQIVAVGDMAQKIYDKTRLNVFSFINDFLGEYATHLEFTQCFRIPKHYAAQLGRVWNKTIIGVNEDCSISHCSFDEALEKLLLCERKHLGRLLCLGQNTGKRSFMLNKLEELKPEVYNKNTVWSKVNDGEGGSTNPNEHCAIFTTYDGCKGMERDMCFIFDWTESYWQSRISKPNARLEIIRNIFCVAASRGKRRIVFVDSNLKFNTLMKCKEVHGEYDDMQMSSMFDFKFIEDVEKAYETLSIKEVNPKESVIDVNTADGLIDISSCIGIFQEANYFNDYDIEKEIEQYFQTGGKDKVHLRAKSYDGWTMEMKILYYVALQTGQDRYLNQVKTPFMADWQWKLIEERLNSKFTKDSTVQQECVIPFYKDGKRIFDAKGFCDVLERRGGEDIVYELKFVSELSHTHFLQCACYIVAMGLKRGYLINVLDNQMYEIRVPNVQKFLDTVTFAITKGTIEKYEGMRITKPRTKKPSLNKVRKGISNHAKRHK